MTPSNVPNGTPVTPKDASAVVLLRDRDDPKVFWVKRSQKMKFMAGYYAFPGGQRDPEDSLVPVANCSDREEAPMVACAAREIFEETGVLIARGGEALTSERRALLRRELIEDRLSFRELLELTGLVVDARDFAPAPRWVTPHYMPRRYDTRFYAVWLPDGQETEIIPGELELGEWLRPAEALHRWCDGACLIASPILHMIQALSLGVDGFVERLDKVSQAERDRHERIEMRLGFFLCPLRTPTIPPATHTNCYVIGGDEMVVIDPGSAYPEEQEKLDTLIESLVGEGRRIREVIITHLHPDHTGGVQHLVERFSLPVAAHRLTAEAIASSITVDRLIEDGDLILLGGEPYWRLRAIWSPGHARGHLSFYEERTGTLISGDLVVGFGTVVIAPPEGNMNDYLASLRRLLELPRLTALLPGHGPILEDARGKIEEYITHRLEREAQIVALLSDGPRSIPDLVKVIYADIPEAMHRLAAASVEAHLEKLGGDGRVSRVEEGYALRGS